MNLRDIRKVLVIEVEMIHSMTIPPQTKNDWKNSATGRLESILKITHTIHGTGIFTYMNGWFLW